MNIISIELLNYYVYVNFNQMCTLLRLLCTYSVRLHELYVTWTVRDPYTRKVDCTWTVRDP